MKNSQLFTATLCLFLACSRGDLDKQSGGPERGGPGLPFTETGELQAVRNTNVVMPSYDWDYGQPQITFLEKEGTLLKQGEIVAEVEKSGVLKVLENEKANLAIAEADLKKMKVDNEMALKKLEAEYQTALSDLQQARIDTQRVRYEPESRRQAARLSLEKSGIALQKAGKKLEATRQVQEQDLKIQLVRIEQIKTTVNKAERTIVSLSLRAPANGMIVHSLDRWSHEKVKVGDRRWPGQTIGQLPDLTQMKVLTSVNETDIRKIDLKQKVSVRLDAFPDLKFDGRIITISHICHKKNKNSDIKMFDVEVLLEQTHQVFKPGMTTNCEFLLTE